jgi:drug/metabolite transporter (DMT)-like permease
MVGGSMFYSWIYVFVNAFSALLRQISGDFLSPAVVLLFSCCYAVIYFHLINIHKLKAIYNQCWRNKKSWFFLSILAACIWLSAIYSPSYIGASLYTFLFFATYGILGTIHLYRRNTPETVSYVISLLGLLILLSLVIGLNLDRASHIQLLGLFLACFGGISGFFYSQQSAAFVKTTSLSASQILAVRFYLTIVACFFFLPAHPLAQLTPNNLLLTLMVSIFCLIIPLYCIQRGIQSAGPALNAIIASSVPLVATLLEQCYFHDVDHNLFIISILYSFFTSLPYLVKQAAKFKYLIST